MGYSTIFDMSTSPYPWGWIVAFFFASFAALIWLSVQLRRRAIKESAGWIISLLLFASAAMSSSSLYQYWHLRSVFASGHYQVVEGEVSAFSPMPLHEHAEESFTVARVRFSYARNSSDPAFHKTAIDGGPICEGLRVRIAHYEGKILRLEVAYPAAGGPISK